MTRITPASPGPQPMKRISQVGPLARAVAIAALAMFTVVFVVMLIFDWNWVKGPLERYVASATGRTLVLGGDISGTWSLRPTFTFRDVQYANPGWAEQPYLLEAKEIMFTISLGTLFSRPREIEALAIRGASVGLEIGSEGRRSWRLDTAQSDPEATIAIKRLIIERGQVRYLDRQGETDLLAKIGAREADTTSISLAGQARATALRLEIVTAGATETLRAAQSPGADSPKLSGSGNIGEAKVEFTGHLGPGHALAGTRLDIRANGPDLAAFRSLARAAIPATPRYLIDAAVAIEAKEATVQLRPSEIGRSRLRGEMRVALGEPRMAATGQFTADPLHLGDLGPMIGAGQTATRAGAAAKAKAAGSGAGDRIFPDMAFDTELWPNADLDLSLDARRVVDSGRLAIDAFTFRARLRAGELEVDPLSVSMANGKVSGTMALNRRGDAVALTSRLRFDGLQLQRIAPATERLKASFGTINGQFNIAGTGRSVRAMLASSDGQLALVMGGGEISNLVLELVGLDGGEALRFLLTGDRRSTLRCAVASLPIRQGMVKAEAVVIDTDDTLIRVTGNADLGREHMDLTMHPQPKDWSLFVARSPIHIRGTFTDPRIFADAGSIGARAAASLLLGLVNPLAALIPLIETGGAADADCKTLIRAVQAGARPGKQQVR